MIFPGTSAERREGKKEAFMAENKKFVITVGRQYGSGGAEMAKRLGERLGLHVYDKEILKMTSEESGIRESYFHLADEKAGNKLLYRIIHSLIPENGTPSLGSDLISSDNLFRFQSSVIRNWLRKNPVLLSAAAPTMSSTELKTLSGSLCMRRSRRGSTKSVRKDTSRRKIS